MLRHESPAQEAHFSNDVLENDNIPAFEQVELTPIAVNYWKVMQWNWLISMTVTIGSLTIFIGWINDWHYYTWIVSAALLLLFLINYWIQKAAFQKKKYAIRHHDVIYQHGRLSTTFTVVPYTRIQHVSIYESWLAKKWQLAQLKIYTTGDTTIIPGLERETAFRIQSLILSKINKPPAKESIDIEDKDHG